MNENIKNFSIFKIPNQVDDGKKPTHSISAKIGESYVNIGSCWTKEGTKGKYLSCQLSKPYQDKPGFHVEPDLAEVKSTKTSPTPEFPDGIDLSNAPF